VPSWQRTDGPFSCVTAGPAANPVIKGSAHAWIGIVLGGLNLVFSLLLIGLFILAAMTM